MAVFWKKHWFDMFMVVAGLLFYLFVVDDKRFFLLLLVLIGGRNVAVWVRSGKLK